MFITRKTHPALWNWKHELSSLETMCGFFVDPEKYREFRKEADHLLPHLKSEERDAWAAHAAKHHRGFHSGITPEKAREATAGRRHYRISIAALVLLVIIILLLLTMLFAKPLKAEPHPFHERYTRAEIAAIFGFGPEPQGVTPIYPFQFDSSQNLKVNCLLGCSASAGFTDNSAFTVGTSTINVIGAYFTSGADPAVTTGNAARLRIDGSSNLRVNCIVGCAAAGDTVGTSVSLNALNVAASVALAGENGVDVIFTVAAAPSFTVVAEVSPDGGTTWFSAVFIDPVSGATSVSLVNPGNGQWQIGYIGAQSNARVRVSAFTSGSISAQLRSTVTRPWTVVLGSDGTNVRAVRTATDGTIRIDPTGTTTQPVSGTVTANAGANLNTSALQLDATGAKLNNAQGSTTLGQTGPLDQCAVTTAAPTYTTAQTDPLSCNTSGGLRVDGSGVTQPISAASLPLPTGAATSANQPTLLADNGAAAATNRTGTLPAIARTNLSAAATAGRDAALNIGLHGILRSTLLPETDLTTYAANKTGLASAASATDIAVLPGNATNTVIVTRVQVTCTQTTAGIIDLQLIKRSAADTAGTSAAMTIVPLDSNNGAAVSAPLTYTANPTTGTAVGNVDSVKVGCMAPGTATPSDIYIWRPGMGQSIVLRGTAQQLAVNLNGVTVTGGSFDITFQWMETTGL